MELKVIRKWKRDNYTIGQLYVNGKRFSDTLEDTDRKLNNNMSEQYILSKKVYGKTAIPTGEYEIKLTWSNKFHNRAWCKKYGGKCPQLMNVKGFEGVRIHPLNSAQDTLGCIGVGQNKQQGRIINSTAYFIMLMDSYIMPAIKKGEKIMLTIE